MTPADLTTARVPKRSLLYPGYGTAALMLCLGMVASIAALGLTMPYYNKAASDMVSVYDALLFNSRLPQEFLVYPGLLSRVLLGWWLNGLHAIGLIPISRLEELKNLSDMKAYDAQWQSLVVAGRVYALLTGMACVMATVALVKRWLGSWQIAILAGTALAFSSGVALGFRILRPEMMAATFVFSALLLTLIAAKEERAVWRLLALVVAGFLVSLAILEKVQSVIPAVTILPLALAFGATRQAGSDDERSVAWVRAAALGALALLALWPAITILGQGIAQSQYKPLSGGLSGRYQWIIGVAIISTMAGYAALWRVSVIETVAAIAAVGLGLACGFDLLWLQSSNEAVIAVANPLEHLQGLSAGNGAMLLSQSPLTIFSTLFSAIGQSIAVHTFVLKPMHRPTLIIEWLALAGMVIAYRRGHKLLALQILMLVGCAIAQDAIFSLRQVKVYYLPYSDFPIILAGALALSQFTSSLMLPKWERATLAVMVVYIIWGHAQPALAAYSRHDKGKVCGIVVLFTKRITIPYCTAPSPPPVQQ